MKGKMIDFGNEKYYVGDELEYEGKEYLYIVGTNFNKPVELMFICKCDDGKYETVMDQELFNKLTLIETNRLIAEQANK